MPAGQDLPPMEWGVGWWVGKRGAVLLDETTFLYVCYSLSLG